MIYLVACACTFLAAYFINILYITIFYHRAITHSAIEMHPSLKRFVIGTGNWITGLDPKGWTCMHRLHHEHSDTKKDPHSPVDRGIWKVLPLQLYSYNKVLAGLIVGKPYYTAVVKDLDFPVNWLNRKGLWLLPYALHGVIAVAIGIFFNAWLLAACYWVGIMSHPIQGWMVNALAHRYGYRNFETPDNSRNNLAVSWLVFGEGFQNNHHHAPRSAKFSVKKWEVDLGYSLCRAFSAVGLVKFN